MAKGTKNAAKKAAARARVAGFVTENEKWAALAAFVKALGSLPHHADVEREKLLAALGK